MLGVPQNMADGDTVSAAGGRLQTTTERGAGLRVLVPSILSIVSAQTAPRIINLPDANVTIPAGTLLTGTLANINRLDSTSSSGVVKESQIADAVTGNVLTIGGALGGARSVTAQDKSGTWALVDQDPSASFKNKLINPNYDVYQLGTFYNTTGYTADQWYMSSGGTAATVSITARTLGVLARPGKVYAFFQTSVGTTAPTFENRVEKVENFAGDSITVSVTGKTNGSSRSVTVNVIQNFGAGGSPSGSVTTAVGTLTLTTTLARTSVTVSVPSISGKTLGTAGDYVAIQLAFPTTTSESYSIYDVQAERGTIMTDFEQRRYEDELRSCMRYLPTWNGNGSSNSYLGSGPGVSTTVAVINLPLKVAPRIAPSGVANSGGTTLGANDGTTNTALTSMTFIAANDNTLTVSANTAAGLTAFRPYLLQMNSTGLIYATGCQL